MLDRKFEIQALVDAQKMREAAEGIMRAVEIPNYTLTESVTETQVGPLRTSTVCFIFGGEAEFNEAAFAQIVAGRFAKRLEVEGVLLTVTPISVGFITPDGTNTLAEPQPEETQDGNELRIVGAVEETT